MSIIRSAVAFSSAGGAVAACEAPAVIPDQEVSLGERSVAHQRQEAAGDVAAVDQEHRVAGAARLVFESTSVEHGALLAPSHSTTRRLPLGRALRHTGRP